MTSYRIDIHTGTSDDGGHDTGHDAGPGPDANVFVTLYGSLASSGELALRHAGRLVTQSVTGFSVRLGDLGDLTRMRIRHDNSGVAPGWFLERVEVADEDSLRRWTFLCERWLARDKDDGQIERILDGVPARPLRGA